MKKYGLVYFSVSYFSVLINNLSKFVNLLFVMFFFLKEGYEIFNIILPFCLIVGRTKNGNQNYE